jgi:RimJ/RimL family protein N-acetyltransferase
MKMNVIMTSNQRILLKNGISVIIREAEIIDAENIIKVINRIGAEKVFILTESFIHDVDWEKNFIQEHVKDKKDALLVVAEIDGKIVGVSDVSCGRFLKNKHTAGLGISIVKEWRGLGIGTAMMTYMINWAKNRGMEKLYLSVFSTNQRAINLYKKFNFQVEGIRKKQYQIEGKYVDEIFFGKVIG